MLRDKNFVQLDNESQERATSDATAAQYGEW